MTKNLLLSPEQSYANNLELFALQCPLEAYRLERTDTSHLEFCLTDKGEINLLNRRAKKVGLLYAPEGAYLEADKWAQIVPLADSEVIFVYGLGLGYYYAALKSWLNANPKHHLVFIEEDPGIVSCFLQTPLATEILQHPQVWVRLYPCLLQRDSQSMEDFWAQLRVVAAPLFWAFAQSKPHVTALQAYFVEHFAFFDRLVAQWYSNLSHARWRLKSFVPDPNPVLNNLYANMHILPETICGEKLFGSMSGLPVLLCGAGPSLSKQLPHLKALRENALLVAAGSAISALTRTHLMPHLVGGVDPVLSPLSRQLTSFEIPIFYQIRYTSHALAQWHGPRLYITGGTEFPVNKWFEHVLGIESQHERVIGMSTTNFLLEVMVLLGCQPIILVGVDLAYTHDRPYSSEVAVHPADEPHIHRELHEKEKSLMPVGDVHGATVYTKREWFLQAVHFVGTKHRNPQIPIFNATEGGFPIPLIPNMTLQTAVEQYLNTSVDMSGWLHGAIQNAASEWVSYAAVKEALKRWQDSLERCQEILQHLSRDLTANAQRLEQQKNLPFGPYSGRATLWQVELQAELVYEHLLQTLDVVFDTVHSCRCQTVDRMEKGFRQQACLLQLERERCDFLLSHVSHHLEAMYLGEKTHQSTQRALAQPVPQLERLREPVPPPEYRTIQPPGHMRIVEPSLELDVCAPFDPPLVPRERWPKEGQQPILEALQGWQNGMQHGQTLYFYSNGALKAEAFYHQGKLHGPSTLYSHEGVLLARSWYVAGQKQGRSCYYYRSGALYSQQGYRGGQPHGQQLYYYPDGVLKTRENYVDGLLDGVVQLYYSNGQPKKEWHFHQGELHGFERVWDVHGKLVLEVHYAHNQAVNNN